MYHFYPGEKFCEPTPGEPWVFLGAAQIGESMWEVYYDEEIDRVMWTDDGEVNSIHQWPMKSPNTVAHDEIVLYKKFAKAFEELKLRTLLPIRPVEI